MSLEGHDNEQLFGYYMQKWTERKHTHMHTFTFRNGRKSAYNIIIDSKESERMNERNKENANIKNANGEREKLVRNNRIANFIRFSSKWFWIVKWFFEWFFFFGAVAFTIVVVSEDTQLNAWVNSKGDVNLRSSKTGTMTSLSIKLLLSYWSLHDAAIFGPDFQPKINMDGQWTHTYSLTSKNEFEAKNYWRLVCRIVHLLLRFASIWDKSLINDGHMHWKFAYKMTI